MSDHEAKDLAVLRLLDELVAGRAAEGGEIGNRSWISGEDFERAARGISFSAFFAFKIGKGQLSPFASKTLSAM